METLVFSEILNGCCRICQLEDEYYSGVTPLSWIM